MFPEEFNRKIQTQSIISGSSFRVVGCRRLGLYRACATNLVSLILSCHRVVRKGSGLNDYRWGIERKRCLLEAEGAPHD